VFCSDAGITSAEMLLLKFLSEHRPTVYTIPPILDANFCGVVDVAGKSLYYYGSFSIAFQF